MGIKNTQVRPRFSLLTQEQVQEIHYASLEILETIGMRILNEEGVQMLADAGCRVKNGNVVRIPNWLVEEAIKSAPSRISIFDQKGKEAMRLEGRNNYYGMGTDLISTLDLETGETRPSMLQDVVNAALVGDYCKHVDFIASFALPHDVPTNTMYIECVRAMLQNSTKPVFNTAAGKEDLAYIIQLCEAVAGGEGALREKPFFIHYSEPTPPLTHSYGAVNKLFLCADKGVPICYPPGAVLGGSAPATLAGGIVQANAEALSGIVLHQLRCKGSPIISGFAAVPMDMRTTTFSYACPGFRLTNSAYADMFHYYNIPMWSTVGTDSHALDEQAAMEHAFCTLLSSLDGANLIHDIGYLGQGLLSSPAAIVMSDEIISYTKKIIGGFDISREKMGLDVIAQVGPGGNYLSQRHTVENFRTEFWRPQLVNRENPETWEALGRPRYGQKATQKARAILATHEPEQLPANVDEALDAIVGKAREALAGFQFTA
ncbi:MAG: trimethylamine methyltransferase family protein [Anaerolineales bacterium]|nr:trimethylamine methyltransferase family protein [Anaerolineales bacterium]